MNTKKIASSLLLAAILALPVLAIAAPPNQPPTGKTWDNLVTFVTGTIYTVGIAIIVVMFLIAGIMFITAGGNPEKVQAARQTLLYAVVGAVVLLVAASIFGIIQTWLG
ncbi:MAG: TrbC/VirB2 family protein [Candidatus Staskawiczbacteria bacterium]|nr:TrbC/VirB2 family protein [Candidatus Staskawiczbacteria bacterium]